MHAVSRVTELMARDGTFAEDVELLRRLLESQGGAGSGPGTPRHGCVQTGTERRGWCAFAHHDGGMHAVSRVAELMERDGTFAEDVELLRRLVES